MKKYVLGRTKTLALLDYLAGSSGNNDATLYIPPRSSPIELESFLKNISASSKISDELVKITTASPTGAVVFKADGQIRLVISPFSVKDPIIFNSVETGPLRNLLKREYVIGVVLVRLGSYAVGLCQGEKLVDKKIGTGLIHGRHRQGGSSSHRFERHRDKQIEQFLIRVCSRVREHLEPHEKSLDFMVYGGARTTILMAQKYCPWLEKLKTPTLPPLLDIPEPRLPVLQNAVTRVWSSTVYEWTAD
ncbi:MAG: Vms1/Ankzf1 family peptidyl-tRNA hydrolase [Dehalococcoidales bacterium]|nr:Vms1/Ankzf1 family peptidyl-tRNA hydrolase [Dehalococcoidales bacterium]